MKVQRVFEARWHTPKSLPLEDFNGDVVKLRPWQREFLDVKSTALDSGCILNAPTGSGKSKAICFDILCQLETDPRLRAIISVPQQVIAASFTAPTKVILGKSTKVSSWYVSNNLCDDNIFTEASKVKQLERFLVDKVQWGVLSKRVIICTHQTLANAFKCVARRSFANVILWIDEAHHVSGDDESANCLGDVVRYFISHPERVLSVNLATATMFRGDRRPIVQQENNGYFRRFNLPYDDHFDSLKWLKSFTFDLLITGGDENGAWIQAIEKLFCSSVDKTIVFIPHRGTSDATSCKYSEVNRILDAIGLRFEARYRQEDGILYVRRGNREVCVVDLVSEDRQDAGKRFIIERPNEVDVVIALNMFNEGADWPQANRVIIAGARGSLTNLMQMIGRVFRDHRSKSARPAKIYQVISVASELQKVRDDEKLADRLNNYMKTIYAIMILMSVVHPVRIAVKTKSQGVKARSSREVMQYILNTITATDYERLFKRCSDAMIDVNITNPKKRLKDLQPLYLEAVLKCIRESSLSDREGEVAQLILNTFRQQTFMTSFSLRRLTDGLIDVGKISFDALMKADPLGGIKRYVSQVSEAKTLRDFRVACGEFLPFEAAREYARSLRLRGMYEWISFCKESTILRGVPRCPKDVYKEFTTWGDWLGYHPRGQDQIGRWLPFEEAREYARSLKLSGKTEWVKLSLPLGIPRSPSTVYKTKFLGWFDWFGKDKPRQAQPKVKPKMHRKKTVYLSRWREFDQAREYVRSLNLKNQHDWKVACKTLPADIPTKPQTAYPQFTTFADWLGCKLKYQEMKGKWRSFQEAREYARSLGLSSSRQWQKVTLQDDFPVDVKKVPYTYPEWTSWSDWLGCKPHFNELHMKWMPFQEARKYARSCGLRNIKQWLELARDPRFKHNIPRYPDAAYPEWISWHDWLDT